MFEGPVKHQNVINIDQIHMSASDQIHISASDQIHISASDQIHTYTCIGITAYCTHILLISHTK